jgi:aminopeptidase N
MIKSFFLYSLIFSSLFFGKLEAQTKAFSLPDKINYEGMDLVHTRLALEFDWSEKQVFGLANLTFTPYQIPQKEMTLDAKGFEIESLQRVNGEELIDLKYEYNGLKIKIQLDKIYAPKDTFELMIAYTAKPDEQGGSESIGKAIQDEKGLYFINPKGEIPNIPRQIWTQGETESSSAWFPTIEKTYQRCTQEMYITVDTNFVTLSNGEYVYGRENGDGTRTDYWKMDLPHAPYLFMLAVGEFAVVKDTWEGKEVSYYVEPKFKPYARSIFGKTPKMIEFFSNKLQYPFPWAKYSQVIVRNFVSGAMENTTASVFYDYIQVDSIALLDEHHEGIIAHELFHQWFGDLVTCQSWSELVLNEGFADYAEYLWAEEERGLAEADYIGFLSTLGYLEEAQEQAVPIIRTDFADPDDLFDAHSYNKGGRVLHMLRKLVGEEIFWKSLNLYLTKNAFQAVSLSDLQQAFEEVYGEELNWFFGQWFLQAGHPLLSIKQEYIPSKNITSLQITQIQGDSLFFRLPLPVTYWQGEERKDTLLWLDKHSQFFSLPTEKPSQVIMIDEGNDVLAVINHQKSIEEWIFQYQHATRYAAKQEALLELEDLENEKIKQIYLSALSDSFWVIREQSLFMFEEYEGKDASQIASKIIQALQKDSISRVRTASIEVLSSFKNMSDYQQIYKEFAQKDKSYAVTAAALRSYWLSGAKDVQVLMETHENTQGYEVAQVITDFYLESKNYSKAEWINLKIQQSENWSDYELITSYGKFLKKCPLKIQQEGLEILKNILQYSGTDWHKISAYTALSYWKEKPEVKKLLKQYEKIFE